MPRPVRLKREPSPLTCANGPGSRRRRAARARGCGRPSRPPRLNPSDSASARAAPLSGVVVISMRSSSSASNAQSTSSDTAVAADAAAARGGHEPVADLGAPVAPGERVQHHVAEERALGVVGHRQAEELAAGPQAGLAGDEATHPVLRRVLVGADQHPERRGRRGRRPRTRRRRAPAGAAARSRRARDPPAPAGWALRARVTSAGTFARDAPPGDRCSPCSPSRAAAATRARTPTSPRATFKVEVVDASFPRAPAHRRARRAEAARAQRRRRDAAQRRRDRRDAGRRAATPRSPSVSARAAPAGRTPAARSGCSTRARGRRRRHVNTWSAGTLRAGETRELTWKLVAARAGTYTIGYRVSPGLTGHGRRRRGRTSGTLHVTIDDEPVPARVGEDGEVERGVERRRRTRSRVTLTAFGPLGPASES